MKKSLIARALTLISFSCLPCLAQAAQPAAGSTTTSYAAAGAPPPAIANSAPLLRPPLTPSYAVDPGTTASTAVPQGNTSIVLRSPPPVAPSSNTNTAAYTSNTDTDTASNDKHHQGLVEDTADVAVYIVKAYVWTYVVVPSKIIKGTINALF